VIALFGDSAPCQSICPCKQPSNW